MPAPPPPNRSGPTPAEVVADVMRESAENVEYHALMNAVVEAAKRSINWPNSYRAQAALRAAVLTLE